MSQEKQKFNLTSDMINISKKDDPSLDVSISKKEMTNLTLRVPKSFVKDFKVWCANQELTMSVALQLAFDKLKK